MMQYTLVMMFLKFSLVAVLLNVLMTVSCSKRGQKRTFSECSASEQSTDHGSRSESNDAPSIRPRKMELGFILNDSDTFRPFRTDIVVSIDDLPALDEQRDLQLESPNAAKRSKSSNASLYWNHFSAKPFNVPQEFQRILELYSKPCPTTKLCFQCFPVFLWTHQIAFYISKAAKDILDSSSTEQTKYPTKQLDSLQAKFSTWFDDANDFGTLKIPPKPQQNRLARQRIEQMHGIISPGSSSQQYVGAVDKAKTVARFANDLFKFEVELRSEKHIPFPING